MNLFWMVWLVAFVACALLWVAARSRMTRRRTWQQAKKANDKAEESGTGAAMRGALRFGILHDGLTLVLRWRMARTEILKGRIAGHVMKVAAVLPELEPALRELRRSAAAVGSSLPPLSAEVAGRLNIALFLGDCAVISAILMQENESLSLVLALVTCAAIATCQFGVGKWLGRGILRRFDEDKGVSLGLAAGAIVLLGVSLGALLYGVQWAWGFVAITPAIGAAALTVVSHDDPRTSLFRAQRAQRRPRRLAVRAVKRLGRAVGKACSSWTKAATLAARLITAPEQAEAAAGGVITVGPHLTDNVRGVQRAVEDVQLIKLGQFLDKAVKNLEAIQDRLNTMSTGAIDLAAGIAHHDETQPGPGTDEGHDVPAAAATIPAVPPSVASQAAPPAAGVTSNGAA